MKRLTIVAAVAIAAAAGGGAALVGASPAARPAATAAVANLTAAQPQGAAAAGGGAGPVIGTAGGTAQAASGQSMTGSSASASTGSSTTAADEPNCDRRPWPDRVQGSPASLDGGDRAGDYLWHGSDGFHLRVTHHGDGRDVFTGVIHASAPMHAEAVKLEGKDAFALSANRLTLTYTFYDYGHIDGVDFTTDCAARLFIGGLRVNGDRLGADHVYLGAHRTNPEHVPFVIGRSAA